MSKLFHFKEQKYFIDFFGEDTSRVLSQKKVNFFSENFYLNSRNLGIKVKVFNFLNFQLSQLPKLLP